MSKQPKPNDERFTPLSFLSQVKHGFFRDRGFDLDPYCSDPQGERMMRHKLVKWYYTKDQPMPPKRWCGLDTLWVNPPYSLLTDAEFRAGMLGMLEGANRFAVLVNNSTETQWFRDLLAVSEYVVLLRARIKFEQYNERYGQYNEQYDIGEDEEEFIPFKSPLTKGQVLFLGNPSSLTTELGPVLKTEDITQC